MSDQVHSCIRIEHETEVAVTEMVHVMRKLSIAMTGEEVYLYTVCIQPRRIAL